MLAFILANRCLTGLGSTPGPTSGGSEFQADVKKKFLLAYTLKHMESSPSSPARSHTGSGMDYGTQGGVRV